MTLVRLFWNIVGQSWSRSNAA